MHARKLCAGTKSGLGYVTPVMVGVNTRKVIARMQGRGVRSCTVTKDTWGRYVAAISSNQSEIADKVGTSAGTVSRWISGDVVPSAQNVIALARAYQLSPVAALVAAGYLEPDEITNSGVQPRALALHEFSDLELARETVRRIESGAHPVLEAPLDASHPAMHGRNVGADDDTADLAEVTVLSRRESKALPVPKAAKTRSRRKGDDQG